MNEVVYYWCAVGAGSLGQWGSRAVLVCSFICNVTIYYSPYSNCSVHNVVHLFFKHEGKYTFKELHSQRMGNPCTV